MKFWKTGDRKRGYSAVLALFGILIIIISFGFGWLLREKTLKKIEINYGDITVIDSTKFTMIPVTPQIKVQINDISPVLDTSGGKRNYVITDSLIVKNDSADYKFRSKTIFDDILKKARVILSAEVNPVFRTDSIFITKLTPVEIEVSPEFYEDVWFWSFLAAVTLFFVRLF